MSGILPSFGSVIATTYNFSVQMSQGFNAVFTLTDVNDQLITLQNATFSVTNLATNVTEYHWTINSGNIILSNPGKVQLNVPYVAGSRYSFIPKSWHYANEQYPWQNYSYLLTVTDTLGNSVQFTGNLIIYQF